MKCPFCGTFDSQVIDSRVADTGDSIRRRRRCLGCNRRFTTYEVVEVRLPQVVKQGGQREDFNMDKVRVSLKRALHKRPVPSERVEAALERIRQYVLALGEREVMSRQMGEMVMEELRHLDKVAYVRFASVYRSFQDMDDFRDVIRDL
ncbi:MAG: transcriptional regulator NrdR [Betaproteobacteria bacterium]|jgi:transcriptional regulator NrdR|nr:transcriptional regulator NrdR [Betaproteobacteria bacterium]